MALLYRPMNAASRMKGSTGRFTRRIWQRVIRNRPATRVEADEDNDTSGFDIQCAGEDAQQHNTPSIEPNAIIHPLKISPPRIDAHVPEVGSGRRKSSPSDHLTGATGDAEVAQDYDTIESVDLDDFPSTPSGINQREAHVNKALHHLIGATPPASERTPPRMQVMEKRSRVPPQQSTQEAHAKEHMRHRRMKTRNSNLMRTQSRRSGHSRKLSFEKRSIQREDSMLSMIQSDRCRMATELPKPKLDLSALITRSQIIEAAIPNHNITYRAEWEAWLKDYFSGCYSIIKPPKAPRRHSTFTYLPALSPDNEGDRITALERLNPEWSAVQEAQGMRLIRDAQNEFEVPGAAISLVVSNLEIMKVEDGYGLDAIKRQGSIAAHALLSTEVLFILDTQNDWRFKGNPLVTGGPKIRFFAGAPMMDCSGAVVGVFTIFGYEPREEFTVLQRRQLTEYSAATMSNIMSRSKHIPTPPLMMRPRTPVAFGQPTPQASFDGGVMAIHPAFRLGFRLDGSDFDAAPQRTLETPEFKNNIQNWNANVPMPGQPAPETPLTPPSNDLITFGDEDDNTLRQPPTGLHNNHRDLPLSVQHPNLTFRERQSDGLGVGSPMLGSWTPRPFSGSDLTSVEGRPRPTTPVEGFVDDTSRSRVDDDSYLDGDQRFRNEEDKARLIVEYTANQDAAAFYREDLVETPTKMCYSRPSSRPLLSYDEPPEERDYYSRPASKPLLSYDEPPEERDYYSRPASRPLLSYDEPPEERAYYYR